MRRSARSSGESSAAPDATNVSYTPSPSPPSTASPGQENTEATFGTLTRKSSDRPARHSVHIDVTGIASQYSFLKALDANNEAMAAVIAAMKAAGVADRDLQTAGIQIQPRYNYTNKPDGSQDAELVAYQVINTLSVRVRDIAKTGEVLDKAVSLGVNQGGGITFTNEKPEGVITEARKLAVADAIAKAKVLAEAAGVKVGKVLEITDQSYAPPPMPMQAKSFDRAAGAAPVEAGENAYRVQVNVTFELKN